MKLILGVGGGIAAYKAAELSRLLQDRGFTVQVVMTGAAQQFIQPLTFAALTGRKVITGLFEQSSSEAVLSSSVEHIAVAQDNEILLVAPATADLIGKMARGIADDFLTTTYLAFRGPVIVAPAMNTNMWEHAAVRANLDILRERGHAIVDPEAGLLACGTIGPGRLAEPRFIADEVVRLTARKQDLAGEVFVVTAGPTQEPIDPVRYITNRSSGKMGYALAEAAAARGARVVLISGPVNLTPPAQVDVVRVRTAAEMHAAVMAKLGEATVVIKSAAVADYHVANVAPQKVKKTAARLSLDLDPTTDILAEVGKRKGDRLLIGFAAETQNMVAEAKRKMETKNCDMVVGNFVNQDGTGFESEENEVTLVMRTGEVTPLERASKRVLADQILDHAMRLRLTLHV
ncbi:MAG: bifunctional phosphopantothenoylcysteine decarboxylase/phosphopantothenate--cysteine ligase CoaBC [Bryobacteraceae bacterium]|nr:bifunctional phosphopantothenoylcysteine decarboxylase/phosphopantothenate--cysteine ligase CoaBC [Bryobacteraceae bacterium]